MFALPTDVNIRPVPSVGSDMLNGGPLYRAEMAGIWLAPVFPGWPDTRIFGWSRPSVCENSVEGRPVECQSIHTPSIDVWAAMSPIGDERYTGIDANSLKLKNDFRRSILSFHTASTTTSHSLSGWYRPVSLPDGGLFDQPSGSKQIRRHLLQLCCPREDQGGVRCVI